MGFKFLDQGSNPCPLQWKCRVLTTGPPGKSPSLFLKCSYQPLNEFDNQWTTNPRLGNSLRDVPTEIGESNETAASFLVQAR